MCTFQVLHFRRLPGVQNLACTLYTTNLKNLKNLFSQEKSRLIHTYPYARLDFLDFRIFAALQQAPCSATDLVHPTTPRDRLGLGGAPSHSVSGTVDLVVVSLVLFLSILDTPPPNLRKTYQSGKGQSTHIGEVMVSLLYLAFMSCA